MILFIVATGILLTGCVSPYRYFPEEPKWRSNDYVITNQVDNYIVTEDLVYNYVLQRIYLDQINEWRIHNGVK